VDGLWGFVLLAAVLSLTPGPDDVLVVGCTVRGGGRCGLAAAAGVGLGSLAWGVATGVGLASVLSRSPAVFHGVRLAGAGYLVVLGALPLVTPLLRRARPTAPAEPVAVRVGLRGAFTAGLLSDLLNPKIGVFYLALVPQFVPVGAPVLGYSLLLCSLDIAVAMVWFALLTGLAAAALGDLRRPAVVLWSERLLGASLVGIGVTAALMG